MATRSHLHYAVMPLTEPFVGICPSLQEAVQRSVTLPFQLTSLSFSYSPLLKQQLEGSLQIQITLYVSFFTKIPSVTSVFRAKSKLFDLTPAYCSNPSVILPFVCCAPNTAFASDALLPKSSRLDVHHSGFCSHVTCSERSSLTSLITAKMVTWLSSNLTLLYSCLSPSCYLQQ